MPSQRLPSRSKSVAETSRRGHAERLAHGAANDGVDVVVAMGGDGTLNETANGLVGTTTALAPLPGGSTNVFARTIGIARDPLEATGQLLADNRDKLDSLAEALLERETLDEADAYAAAGLERGAVAAR